MLLVRARKINELMREITYQRRENIIIYSVGQPLGDPFGLVEFYYLIDIDRYVYHTKEAICRYA